MMRFLYVLLAIVGLLCVTADSAQAGCYGGGVSSFRFGGSGYAAPAFRSFGYGHYHAQAFAPSCYAPAASFYPAAAFSHCAPAASYCPPPVQFAPQAYYAPQAAYPIPVSTTVQQTSLYPQTTYTPVTTQQTYQSYPAQAVNAYAPAAASYYPQAAAAPYYTAPIVSGGAAYGTKVLAAPRLGY